jgi:hypothetical protein
MSTVDLTTRVEELETQVVQLSAQLHHLSAALHQVYAAVGLTAPQMPVIPSDPRRVETGMGAILAPDKSSFV